MNIAMICDSINLQNSGSLVSTWRYARNLAKKGHKVVIISTGKEDSIEITEGVKIIRFKSFAWPKTDGCWRMPLYVSYKKIKEIYKKEKIEIAHFMIPTPLCFIAGRIAKKLKIPTIAHSHTQPENILMLLNINFSFLKWAFYRYLLWFYSISDVTVCPTQFAESKLLMYGYKNKTKVISNGVEKNKFKIKSVGQKFYDSYKLKKSDKRVLFVGRLWQDKNVSMLIKAMPYVLEKIKDVHLDIVGKIEGEYPLLNELVKNLKLSSNVTFFGRISHEDLNDAYNACDVFCLPSYVELEGMVVLEAMACGKPIIVSDSKESASRFYVQGNGYNFNLTDPKDLADKIIKILSNSKLKKSMGKKSLKIAKGLGMENSIIKLEKLYSGLVLQNQKSQKM